MRKRILAKLKRDRRAFTLQELVAKTGVAYGPLYRIITTGRGHINNWEKLDQYYRSAK